MKSDFSVLKDHLMNVLKESQMKIGYTENAASINYPPASLCRLLGEELNEQELNDRLSLFCDEIRPLLGTVTVSRYEGQYRLTVSSEGVRYVHEHIPDSPFLKELIALIRERRPKEIGEIIAVFQKYSDKVVVEASDNEEYNYVLYFEDGMPDDFVYLVEARFGYVSYHRLTKPDYRAEIESI